LAVRNSKQRYDFGLNNTGDFKRRDTLRLLVEPLYQGLDNLTGCLCLIRSKVGKDHFGVTGGLLIPDLNPVLPEHEAQFSDHVSITSPLTNGDRCGVCTSCEVHDLSPYESETWITRGKNKGLSFTSIQRSNRYMETCLHSFVLELRPFGSGFVRTLCFESNDKLPVVVILR
jgi:hypothetical protein